MSDHQQMQKQELTPLPSQQRNSLDQALTFAQGMLYKEYLSSLYDLSEHGQYSLVKAERPLTVEEPKYSLRMLQLEQLTCKKGEDMHQKLSTVYHAAMSTGCSLFILVDAESKDSPAKLYLGMRDPASAADSSEGNRGISHRLSGSVEALRKGLKSNFPGSVLKEVSASAKIQTMLDDQEGMDGVFGQYARFIAAVSCTASNRDKSETTDKSFVQGIEKLMDVMQGNAYTAVLIADPVPQEQQMALRRDYEALYTYLSTYRKQVISFQENQSIALSDSISHAITESVTNSTAHSISNSHTTTKSINGGVNGSLNVGIGIAAGLAAGVPFIGGHLSTSKSHGFSIGGFVSTGRSASEGNSETDTTSTATTRGSTDTTTHGLTNSVGSGQSLQLEVVNKAVEEMLRRIEEELRRMDEIEGYGAYNCGAYFLSNREENCLLAANTYRALMLGDGVTVRGGAVNLWRDEPTVNSMKEYLKRFAQPVFQSNNGEVTVNAGMLVSGAELPLHMGLPMRSVSGLPVIDHAEFGRNVMREDEGDTILLGNLYHMGECDNHSLVRLDRQNLSAHTFVTGSTGAGKSNTIYTLLNELCLKANGDNGTETNFLVIESAKGEYKSALGGYEGVHVYGTNPRRTQLLRINPFSFPDDTHVLEHIDRLVEIFNACWPMYAAMPAVLKEAIESAYQSCGWDMTNSRSVADRFPTFNDVLARLPEIMNSSDYSSDTKGDYTGALVTRVKSLTNGINGQIFCSDEMISDAEMFDRNVIVDLSRIGSTETKALIMGMLMIKLQEYRMAQAAGTDMALRHITVLEEAHNLLRRTSPDQSQESANLQGKSVEMLANAIAEMRTYGEGFIIADQSPALLDMAVIRNTNTKIIMRLPDQSDRELVGRAAGLNDDQIIELARLELGVAAVFQNEWQEPVLCKVQEFSDRKSFSYQEPEYMADADMECVFEHALYGKNATREISQESADKVKRWLNGQKTDNRTYAALLSVIETGDALDRKSAGKILYRLTRSKSVFQQTKRMKDPETFGTMITQHVVDALSVSPDLAVEIGKAMSAYSAERFQPGSALYERLISYGGRLK